MGKALLGQEMATCMLRTPWWHRQATGRWGSSSPGARAAAHGDGSSSKPSAARWRSAFPGFAHVQHHGWRRQLACNQAEQSRADLVNHAELTGASFRTLKREGSGKFSRRGAMVSQGWMVVSKRFAGAAHQGGAHHGLVAHDGSQAAAGLELRQQAPGTSATEPLSTMTSNGPSGTDIPGAVGTRTSALVTPARCRLALAPAGPARGRFPA
jgi:hypothetical protein